LLALFFLFCSHRAQEHLGGEVALLNSPTELSVFFGAVVDSLGILLLTKKQEAPILLKAFAAHYGARARVAYFRHPPPAPSHAAS
jgi:hypothetical protein